ncbi:hypothetical protein [Sorangium sp. So ce1097]|uniref:hypothetical protein n=1 Tax=Sorangium sp. So ce1097 TaxID=3133330 RepID=UPI003F5E570A
MVALAAVSCGDPDVAELLERAKFPSDDHDLATNLEERGLLCEDDPWFAELYWP